MGAAAQLLFACPRFRKSAAEKPMEKTEPAELCAARRILIVDDDHDVADSLAMYLDTFDATVRVAYGGAEGLELFETFRPELVFLDLGMPRIDGFETARRIRALPEGRDVFLVALTGWGREHVLDRVRAAGFDRHITKPAGIEVLQEVVSELNAGRKRDPA
jgi:CheY-like chemotaxis protein